MVDNQQCCYWLARHILPNEQLVRTWLRRFPNIEVDDIIQEAYVIISEKDINNITNPIAYFHMICRNLVLKNYKKSRIVEIVALTDIQNDALIDQSPSLDAIVDARAELRFLNFVIQSLPERCRNVFIDRKVNGFTQKGCSKNLGISENSVEKQLARALVFISKLYAQREKIQATPKTGGVDNEKKIHS
ncbi:RNA polymerase sigma factor [Acetobacter senegalensis]|uniref:RNA polymerase sigma factor n=1 Tax=Acetobacter senegalensis TaxID=446692 RepID=UPI0026529CE5|nr:sigma-70 family RNA polymerase sigma factor [Acetobacter senegalensis]MDN7351865.1 sigma-70 family RNA polymerase sigma factor [Acetobacter senegalensis]